MRFNKIRAISWLLVLVMVFGLLPFGAMAQQSEEPAPPMTEEPSVPTTIVEPADPAVPTEPIPEAPKTFSFTLIGKTVTGEPLNGAGYTLFTAKDAQDAELTKKVGEEGITNAETGEISFKDLPVGTYHLEETTVPENNQKTEDILFTLDDTGKINLLSPESTTEKVLLDVEKNILTLLSEATPLPEVPPMAKAAILPGQMISLTAEELNPREINYTGQSVVVGVTLEVSDAMEILTNPKLVISFPAEHVQSLNPSDLAGASKKTVAKVGTDWVVTYDFPSLAGGTYIQVPITIVTQKYLTPDNYPLVVSTKLVQQDGTVAHTGDDLTITYQTVDFSISKLVYSAGSTSGPGTTTVRPFAGIATAEAPNIVPMDTETYVRYTYLLKGNANGGLGSGFGSRALESVTITDRLPEAAVFDQEKNPKWVYDPDTHTATYNGATTAYIYAGSQTFVGAELFLRYPGADANVYQTNSADLRVTPKNAQSYEDYLKPESIATSAVSHRLSVAAPILSRSKSASPSSFWDQDASKRQIFTWSLYAREPSGETAIDRMTFIDQNLDPRMEYVAVKGTSATSTSYYNGTIDIYATNADGVESLVAANVPQRTGGKPTETPLPAGTTKVRITMSEGQVLEKGQYFYTYVTTKLKDPDSVHYMEPSGNTNNMFRNSMTVTAHYQDLDAEVSLGVLTATLTLKKYEPRIRLTKSISPDANMNVGDVMTNTVNLQTDYFNPLMVPDELKGQMIVDLLPQGIEYVPDSSTISGDIDYTPDNPFVNKEPEIIQNYKGTGKTALIWRLNPQATNNMTGERRYDYPARVTFKTKVGITTTPGFNTNEAYFVWDNNKSDPNATASQIIPELTAQAATDLYDFDDDGNTGETILKVTRDFHYSDAKEVVGMKSVKGSEDVEYVATSGREEIGKPFQYNLEVVNRSIRDVEHLTGVDVLPRIGDKTIVPDQDGNIIPRNSQYNVYLTGPAQAPAGYTLWYNTAAPAEGQLPNDYINGAGWVLGDAVANWEDIVGIKFTMADGLTIPVGEKADIVLPVTTQMDPDTLQYGQLAFNTFAYSINQGTSYVEATTASARIYTYEIRGKTFVDRNQNGLLDNGESAVPQMRVFLRDEMGNPVRNLKGELVETVSDDNGNYSLKFERSGKYTVAFNNTEYLDATILPEGAANNDKASHVITSRPALTELFTVSPDKATMVKNAGFKLMFADINIAKQVRDYRDADLPLGQGPFTYQVLVNGTPFVGQAKVGNETVQIEADGLVSARSGTDIIVTVPVNQVAGTTVKVIESPHPDYTVDAGTQELTVDSKFEYFTFVNREKALGKLVVQKTLTCARGMLVEDQRDFEVTITGPSYPTGIKKTVTAGTDLVLENLIYGDYTVVETPNADYETTYSTNKVKLSVDNKEGTVVINNKEKPLGQITIKKSLKDILGNFLNDEREFVVMVHGASYPLGITRVVSPTKPLVLTDLIYGDYVVTELGADDYTFVISNASHVTIDNKSAEVVITNTEKANGELTLEAVLKDSAGEVLDVDRDFIVTVKGPSYPTGQKMVINPTEPLKLPGLQYGEYTITADPSEIYTTTLPDPVTLTVDKQRDTMVTVFQKRDVGQLTIKKELKTADNKAITEARDFEVTVTGPSYPDGIQRTLTAGTDLVLDNLICGDYRIQETTNVNYTTTGGDVTLTLDGDVYQKTATITNTEKAEGALTIKKVLQDVDGKAITEARDFEVTITGPSYPEGVQRTLTAGTDLALTGLLYGDYTVVETADTNYDTTVSGKAALRIDAKTGTVTVTNKEKANGQLTLTAAIKDATGNAVTRNEDFIVTIKGPSYPEGGQKVVINPTKPLVLKNLAYGTYTIEAVNADYTVTLPEATTLSVTNQEGTMLTEFKENALGKLTIRKELLDQAGKVMTAARDFEVTVTGPSYPTGEKMTLTSGTDLALGNLIYGTYTVVETDNTDYTTTNKTTEVILSKDVKEKAITITNKEKALGELTVTKVLKDAQGTVLDQDKNFEITVTGPSHPTGTKMTLNSKNALVLQGLAYGEYTVEETANDKYDTTVSGKVNLGVDGKTGTITVTNTEKAAGTVSLNAVVKDAAGTTVDGRTVTLKLFGPSYPEGVNYQVVSGTPTEVKDLIYGTYRIEAVDPDSDYTTSVSDPVTLTVDASGGSLTGTFTEKALGQLTVKKELKSNQGTVLNTVKDFEVTITGPSYPTGEKKTLTNGTDLVLENLIYGEYTVVETAHADYDAQVSANATLSVDAKAGTVTVTNTEKALGELTITKALKDVDGNPIDASRDFTISVTGPSYPNGEEMTLNTKTPIQLTNLIYGRYTVTEKGADDYTFVVTNGVDLNVDAKKADVTVTNTERALGTLTLTAVLKNAAGETLNESRELKVKVTGPSYPDGQTMILDPTKPLVLPGLKYGTYTLTSMEDDNYNVTLPEPATLSVTAKEVTLETTFQEKALGQLTVKKVIKDLDGNTKNDVKNFEITITGPSFPTGEKKTLTSGTDLVVENLVYGEYSVAETHADYSTVITDPVTLTVDGKAGTVTVTNTEKAMGTLTVQKVLQSNDGTAIDAARAFEVTVTGPSYPEGIKQTLTSGTDLVLEELKYGTYTVAETHADYTTTVTDAVTLTADAKEGTITVTNKEKALGTVTLDATLVDGLGNEVNGKPLKVKLFGPSYPDGKEFDVTSGTPLDVEGLILGDYRIEAVDATGNYTTSVSDPVSLTLDNRTGRLTATFTEKALGQLTVQKVLKDQQGEAITEARNFEVTITGPSFPTGEKKTLTSGTDLVVENLIYGEYTVVETASAEYTTTGNNAAVALTMAKKEGTVTITNQEKALGQLTVKKVLQTGDAQTITEGRAFEITVTGPSYPEGKKMPLTNLTDLVLDNLIYGEYTVVETANASYDTTVSDPVTLSINEKTGSITVTNQEKAEGELTLKGIYKDTEDKVITGKPVVVKLFGPSYPTGQAFTITSGTDLKVPTLVYGQYSVEVVDPDGNFTTKVSDPVTLTVAQKTGELTAEVKEKALGTLTVTKMLKSADGTAITEGRAFEVTVTGPSYPDGKKMPLINGTDLVLEQLAYGEYTVVETAQADYESTVDKKATLNMDHKADKVTVTNTEKALGALTIKKDLKDVDGNLIDANRDFNITVTGPSYPDGEAMTLNSKTPLVLKDLQYGTYTVTETGAEDYNFVVSNGVTISVTQKTAEITVTNMEKAKGQLTLTALLKDVDGNERTEDRDFKVKITGPSYPAGVTMVVNPTKPLVLPALKYGTYTLEAIDADDYTVTLPDPTTISVTTKEATMATTFQEKAVGKLTVKKVLQDKMGNPIDEARCFEVTITGPSYPTGEKRTLTSGTDLVLENLKYGTYSVAEAHGDYTTTITDPVTLQSDAQEGTITVTNKEIPKHQLTLTATLLDADGNPVVEDRDIVVTIEGPSYPEGKQVTINPTKPLVLTDMTEGTYRILSAETPDGYTAQLPNPVTLTPTNSEGTLNTVFKETAQDKGKITIKPVLKDAQGNTITDNRTFTVKLTGPSYPDGITLTLTNGQTVTLPEGLFYGTYTLEAIDAEKYIVTLPGPIVLSETQPQQNVEVIYQEKADGLLVLKKEHKNLLGENYQGEKFFTFVVTGPSFPEGKLVRVSADNPARLTDLIYGTYEVVEKDEEKTNYTVSGEGSVTLDLTDSENELTIINQLKKKPIDPGTPEDPTDPTDPTNPTKPSGTVIIKKPVPARTWKRPFTGDTQDWPFALAALMLSALSIAEIKRRQIKG